MESNGQPVAEDTVSTEQPEFAVIELNHGNDLSWMLMPILFERIKKFSKIYEPEGNADVLCRAIGVDFTSDEPRFHATVTTRSGRCVGHTLTILENIAGILYANVIQDEIDDDAQVGKRLRLDCLKLIESWTQSKGCDKLHAYANSEAKIRRLEMFYGFKRYKTLLRKVIL